MARYIRPVLLFVGVYMVSLGIQNLNNPILLAGAAVLTIYGAEVERKCRHDR